MLTKPSTSLQSCVLWKYCLWFGLFYSQNLSLYTPSLLHPILNPSFFFFFSNLPTAHEMGLNSKTKSFYLQITMAACRSPKSFLAERMTHRRNTNQRPSWPNTMKIICPAQRSISILCAINPRILGHSFLLWEKCRRQSVSVILGLQ